MNKEDARERLLQNVWSIPFDLPIEIGGKRMIGIHKSIQKGSGFDFVQHIPYELGEDERFIDWNVYMRTGEKVLKRFREEKEIPVMIILDLTPGMFGGVNTFFEFCTLKCEAAFIVAAAFHQKAKEYKDPLGYFLAGAKSEHNLFEPRKGDASDDGLIMAWDEIWQNQLISSLASKEPGGFIEELKNFSMLYDRPSFVVIISDFEETFLSERMEQFRDTIQELKQVHALIALAVRTPWEYLPPATKADCGFHPIGGGFTKILLSMRHDRKLYQMITDENKKELERFLDTMGIPSSFLITNDNIIYDIEKDIYIE